MADRQKEMQILLSELSTEEQLHFNRVLTALRYEHNISEEEYSSSQALRFFRGQNKDPSKAIDSIMSNIRWRRAQPLEKARTLNISQFAFGYAHVKMGFYGVDYEGYPIRIIQPSNFDPKTVLDRYDEEQRYLFALQYLERNLNVVLPLATIHANRYINGIISVIDLKDLNITKVLLNFNLIRDYRKHAQEFQENFPEMCSKTILINANRFVTWVWPLAKWFIRKETRDKFIFLGSNYLPELLKHTSLDKLPVSLGGTCEHDINDYPHPLIDELARSIREQRFRLK